MSWWIWLLVSLVIGVIELTSLTFVLLWIAIAGLITALISPIVTNIWTQVIIFAVISAVLIAVTRPIAKRWRTEKTYKSRMDELVGAEGIVITEATPGAFATIRIQGELWSARSNTNLQAGDTVTVKRATAAVLEVERKTTML